MISEYKFISYPITLTRRKILISSTDYFLHVILVVNVIIISKLTKFTTEY